MQQKTIKQLVKDKTAIFEYYRDNSLWYSIEGETFIFPVPVEDIGNATFKRKEKAILLMRYIRKYKKKIDEEKYVWQHKED